MQFMAEGGQKCSVKVCTASSAGVGAQSALPLCRRHLDHDTRRVRELQASVVERLQPFKLVRDQLRVDQQMLEAELQNAEDQLNATLESLMIHKEAVLSRLSDRNEAAKRRLREFAVLQEYESSIDEAERTNDMQQVFKLSSDMELECNDLEESLTNPDIDGRIELGDVAGGLRDLQLLIDRQVKQVLHLCDSSEADGQPHPVGTFQRKIENLGGRPIWVTSCSNTEGYVSNKAGGIVKRSNSTDSNADKLPRACFFVSTDASSNDHILVLSADGTVSLRCACDIDWSMFISGLHCDSNRQLLYVVQQRSVTVTDLSGCVIRIIDSNSLHHSVSCLCGIGANGDKIFFFDQQEKKIFGLDRIHNELQTVLSVESFYETTRKVIEGLSVLGSTIYLTDFQKNLVHKMCSISGKLRSSYPTSRSQQDTFKYPSDVTVASNGLLFICEFKAGAVRVMTSDGTVLQTLGKDDGVDDELVGPHSSSVLLCSEAEQLLAVADKEGSSLHVYKLN